MLIVSLPCGSFNSDSCLYNKSFNLGELIGDYTLDTNVYFIMTATAYNYIDQLKLIEIETGNEIDLIQSLIDNDELTDMTISDMYSFVDNKMIFNVDEDFSETFWLRIYPPSEDISKYILKINGRKKEQFCFTIKIREGVGSLDYYF